MPSRFFFSSKLSRFMPLAMMLMAVGTAPAAFAQEEPGDLAKLLGAAGLIELPKNPIDYQERAPLVVPPSADLPPPASPDDIRKMNPEWPVDQDIQRAKAAAKGAKFVDQPNDSFYGGRRVTPAEMSNIRGAKKQASTNSAGGGPGDSGGREAAEGRDRYNPFQLGFKGWGKKEEIIFTGEPERTSLLEPPPGYRTPSPNAPYGIVEEDRKTTKNPFSSDRNDDRNQRP